MSTFDTRREQMFPKLAPAEIDRLRRFSTIRRHAAGERLITTGELSPGMFVVISGSVALTRRDGLGHVVPIIELGPGEFVAEVGQVSSSPALVDAQALGDVETLLVNLFLFVGADPATQWLEGCGVALDAKGFVRTGSDDHQPRPLALESNVPGVFAVGDVRSGSVKRVGAAIGEGAAVVAQLHTVLAEAAAATR